MKNIYDENNQPYGEEESCPCSKEQFEGYSVVDAEEVDVDRTVEVEKSEKPKPKIEENYDDGESLEGSDIPQNEQTVIIDSPKISGLSIGDALEISIVSEKEIKLTVDGKKVGTLKPAYVEKLLATRKNQYVECFLHAGAPLVMVKLSFYSKARKGSVKISV